MANINCPNCGKELSDDMKFCKYCGTPIMQINKTCEKDIQENKKSTKGIIIAIVAVVLVVALVLVGWFVIKPMFAGEEKIEEKTTIAQTISNDIPKKNEDNSKSYNLVKETGYNADGSIDYWYEYEYDSKGNLIKEIEKDPNYDEDCCTEYEYDSNGNLIKETYGNSAEGVMGGAEYEYDSKNNMIKESYYGRMGFSASKTYKYDANGNLIKEEEYRSDDNRVRSIEYEYDSKGNVVKETYGGDIINLKVFAYDENGKKTKEETYSNNARSGCLAEYEYDVSGNLIKESVYSFTLPGLDMDDSEEINAYGLVKGDLESWEEYTYDSKGNLLKETHYVINHYNAEDTDVAWREYEYNADGKEIKHTYYTSMEDGSCWVKSDYDINGNLIKETRYEYGSNEIMEWYEYEYALKQ